MENQFLQIRASINRMDSSSSAWEIRNILSELLGICQSQQNEIQSLTKRVTRLENRNPVYGPIE